MSKKIYRKYLVIITAITAVVIVWVKIFSNPDVPLRFLQGLGFTMVMSFLVWASFGFPRGKKPMTPDEIKEYLLSHDFNFSAERGRSGKILIAQTGISLEKNEMVFELFSFGSSLDVKNNFDRIQEKLLSERGPLNYEGSTHSGDYHKYTLKTSDTYDIVLCMGTTIICINADIKDEDEVDDIIKTINC